MRTILPKPLHGELRAMPSKSVSHRALICAALAEGESTVAPIQLSRDTEATLACLEGIGLARISGKAPMSDVPGSMRCRIAGSGIRSAAFPESAEDAARRAPCGESGSTLRFLMPLALDGGRPVRFEGEGRLLQRPLAAYRKLFKTHCDDHAWTEEPGAITVSGRLRGGEFILPGDVSSQFISGLLFALPRLREDSIIRMLGDLESRAYIDLTVSALARTGVMISRPDDRTLGVRGGQRARAGFFAVEGDWSHAAFYLVAGLIGGTVKLFGLDADSLQGDRAIVEILRGMGGEVSREGSMWIAKPSALRGARIDASQTPDLVPPLAVAACAARGRTVIHNAARLRLKECDRLAALRTELCALGAAIEERPDGLVIEGGKRLRGGAADSRNDHRIAMALAVAAALCDLPVELSGSGAVTKSAPAFWNEYASLGGESHARSMG